MGKQHRPYVRRIRLDGFAAPMAAPAEDTVLLRVDTAYRGDVRLEAEDGAV